MTLYVTYIHRSHQIIKPSTMTTTSDIVQDVLICWDQAMYLKKRVYDYEPS
jgi:hypothetical protein